MRTLHRVIAFVCALPLIVIAVSGLALHVHLLSSGPPPMTPPAAPMNDAAILQFLQSTLRHARNDVDAPILVVRLNLASASSEITFANPRPQKVSYTASGEKTPNKEISPLHRWLIQLHRGDVLGLPGVWLSIVCGCALLFLIVTGTTLYLRTLRARRSRNRREIFWQ